MLPLRCRIYIYFSFKTSYYVWLVWKCQMIVKKLNPVKLIIWTTILKMMIKMRNLNLLKPLFPSLYAFRVKSTFLWTIPTTIIETLINRSLRLFLSFDHMMFLLFRLNVLLQFWLIIFLIVTLITRKWDNVSSTSNLTLRYFSSLLLSSLLKL